MCSFKALAETLDGSSVTHVSHGLGGPLFHSQKQNNCILMHSSYMCAILLVELMLKRDFWDVAWIAMTQFDLMLCGIVILVLIEMLTMEDSSLFFCWWGPFEACFWKVVAGGLFRHLQKALVNVQNGCIVLGCLIPSTQLHINIFSSDMSC